MVIGNRNFEVEKHTYVMGILNITPDSFSDGGQYNRIESALKRAEGMVLEGADIIDIGGESTRPGAQTISAEEELDRVIPILKKLRQNFDIPLSVDTYKADVADECIRCGADVINDISGLGMLKEGEAMRDSDMTSIVAGAQIPYILMHNPSKASYGDLLGDITKELLCQVQKAERAGIKKEQIIIDPGIGFQKTYEQNLQVIANLDAFKTVGCPILVGISRKSVIQKTLSLPPQECLEGTIATTVMAVLKGCSFIRVHDVYQNVRAVKMAEALRANMD